MRRHGSGPGIWDSDLGTLTPLGLPWPSDSRARPSRSPGTGCSSGSAAAGSARSGRPRPPAASSRPSRSSTATCGNRETDAFRFAEQELKSLKRVQAVRHPYLLALDRYDIVDGRLMIVMELADCNLWDRFRECRRKGLPGIPRDELLRYMAESAEVLDLMNDQFQLQHLDIKPQNLFLLYNHVKVADFGQVKDLQGMMALVTGGITPVYAAPETFDGFVSRFCDQYSLACVYQELLTGERPFDGTSMQQLLAAARPDAAEPVARRRRRTGRPWPGRWPRRPRTASRASPPWSTRCGPGRRCPRGRPCRAGRRWSSRRSSRRRRTGPRCASRSTTPPRTRRRWSRPRRRPCGRRRRSGPAPGRCGRRW